MTVYLLHFSQPISPDHTTQHYLGWAGNGLRRRLVEHQVGRGARITQVARERGIGWKLVRTWPDGTRKLERLLKKRKNFRRTACPLCNPKAKKRRHMRFEVCYAR